MKAGMLAGIAGMLAVGTGYEGQTQQTHFTRNPKLHHTKPWESIEDARKRKKAERQRKKLARRQSRK